MLNVILKNKLDCNISKVSGIPDNWNRSIYNKKGTALKGLKDIIKNTQSKFFLISYNNEGFIAYNEMLSMLKEFGTVISNAIKYYAFKGSRNLKKRKQHPK